MKKSQTPPKISSNTYSISKIRKLIDLNHDMINFRLNFKITSDGTPFQALIVNQTTLDNVSELEFKQVDDGLLSGEIIVDKNVYQNYFLILKSDTPTSVEVELETFVLPQYIEQKGDGERVGGGGGVGKKKSPRQQSPPTTDDKNNMMYIFACIGVVTFIYFIVCKTSGGGEGGANIKGGIQTAHESLLSKLKQMPLE